jgi:hypothetical protein
MRAKHTASNHVALDLAEPRLDLVRKRSDNRVLADVGALRDGSQCQFDVPGPHRFVVFDGCQMRKPIKQPRQIGVRFNAVGVGGLDQGIQVGARDSTLDGVNEEPAFATQYERANGVLAAVVVDVHVALREEGGELRPLTEGVVHGFPEPALG